MMWAMDDSHIPLNRVRITPRLIDSLYTEAMLLADEARAYFDDMGRDERASLAPFARVGFACESLKVTTRIMHIIAWLLTQRALQTGEIPGDVDRVAVRSLGQASDSDEQVLALLPDPARKLIAASTDLHARVQRLDKGQQSTTPASSPARALMGRLERDLLWVRH